MNDFLLTVLLFIIGLFLGFYLLLFGRKALAFSTAIVCIVFTGGLLALIFNGETTGWTFVEQEQWGLLGITVVAGIVGGILGSRAKSIANNLIGFTAGGYLALWLYDIAFYLIVSLGNWSEETAFWVGVFILIVGGFVALYFTRQNEGIAVIIVSVFIGTDIIITVLDLSSQRSITAVIAISLALLGLVVQYAQYLRENKAESMVFSFESTGRPAPELFDLTDDD